MGMHKTSKGYIFVIEHDADIIPISLYSLNNQLSFDTLHFVFIQEMVKGRNWELLILN